MAVPQGELVQMVDQAGASTLWPDEATLQDDLEWLLVEQTISKRPIDNE